MASQSQDGVSLETRRWFEDERARGRARKALWASAGITLLLYVIPFGPLIAYPLTLFSTFVHELGHGLAALMTGGAFDRLSIFADASGVAHCRPGNQGWAWGLVSAGGLVGPAVLGAIGFVLSRRAKVARGFLITLAVGLLACLILFVRNPFGIVYASLVVLGLGWAAIRGTSGTAQLVAVFMSVQLALSVFSRGDYLFTDEARTGAGVLPSDTANMATALGGTYWMWGLACGAFSILVLAAGMWWFLRGISPRPLRKHG